MECSSMYLEYYYSSKILNCLFKSNRREITHLCKHSKHEYLDGFQIFKLCKSPFGIRIPSIV